MSQLEGPDPEDLEVDEKDWSDEEEWREDDRWWTNEDYECVMPGKS
jgi:hypothetical protein